MTTLIIDVEAIKNLGTDLKTVATEFENANANSDGIAAAVGHAKLSETVHDFAHKWDDTRAEMVDALKNLGEAATTVAANWVDLDQQGADVLTGSGSSAGGPNNPSAT